FSLLQQREPFVFLRVGTKRVNGVHHQGGLPGDKTAEAEVAALEFLSDQAIFHVGHSRAAIALQACAEEAELGHLRNKLHREFSFAVVLLDDGHNLVIDKLASCLPRELFFVAQEGIEVEEVDSGKGGHQKFSLIAAHFPEAKWVV